MPSWRLERDRIDTIRPSRAGIPRSAFPTTLRSFRSGVVGLVHAVLLAQVATAQQQTTIHRDRYGVPHVVAPTEPAGFYALGYAQAEDRLPQLLGGVLWAQGRYAELMGDGALPGDVEMRRWRHAAEARAGFTRLSPGLQRNYRAFVAGANRYLRDHPDQVPPWAPELTPEAFVAITRALYWTGYNAVDGPAECARSGAKLELGAVIGPAASSASNEWAVLPSRTAHGETILLADPHVDVNNPFYYEYGLDAGDLTSYGYAVGPLLWQSQNRHVAWALTTGHPDLWDCYAVTVEPSDRRAYRYDGKLLRMEVRREVFRSSSGKTIERELEYTRHNGVLSPVVARDSGTAWVVSASQMHDAGLMDEEIHRMNRATSVVELRSALATLGMMPQNVLAVDDRGRSYYLRAGKTPRRPGGYDWSAAVPGNTSATAWRGFHPLGEMIEILDFEQGYLQNNNVAPDRMFATGNIDAAAYPKYLFNDTPGRQTSRGQRALDVLSAAKGFTIDDAKALAFDERWIGTGPWQRALRHAMTSERGRLDSLAPPARKLLERILSFDGNASAESASALNFWFWRRAAGALLTSDDRLAPLRSYPWDESRFTPVFSRALLDAADSAVARQIAAVGDLDQPLGRLFRVGRGGKTWPVGGVNIALPLDCLIRNEPRCESTMRAFGTPRESDANGERIVAFGSQAMRLVVFGREPQTWTLYAFGQRSSPGPHHDDQAVLFSERRFKRALIERADVLRGSVSRTVLEVPARY